jgi:hypothetical protein
LGVGDGSLSIIQDTFVAQSVHPAVRAGAMALSGTAKNIGKLGAPLLISGLLAFVSISAAFYVVAAVAALGTTAAFLQRDLTLNDGSDQDERVTATERRVD